MTDYWTGIIGSLLTLGCMAVGVLAVWLIWVRPFDARVRRDMAEHPEDYEIR